MQAIRLRSRFILANTLMQMNSDVDPSLLPAARDLMCQYWGEDFVKFEEERSQSQSKGATPTS